VPRVDPASRARSCSRLAAGTHPGPCARPLLCAPLLHCSRKQTFPVVQNWRLFAHLHPCRAGSTRRQGPPNDVSADGTELCGSHADPGPAPEAPNCCRVPVLPVPHARRVVAAWHAAHTVREPPPPLQRLRATALPLRPAPFCGEDPTHMRCCSERWLGPLTSRGTPPSRPSSPVAATHPLPLASPCARSVGWTRPLAPRASLMVHAPPRR
jgi:hypothetical protein